MKHKVFMMGLILMVAAPAIAETPQHWRLEDLVAKSDPQAAVEVQSLGKTETISLQCVVLRGAVGLHYHEKHTETVMIASGAGIMTLGDQTVEAKAGDVFLVPPGTLHAFEPVGEGPVSAITTFSPPFDGKDRVFVDPPEGKN